MEHFYAPDEILARLHGLLAPGGAIVSTLPLDATPGSPFLERVQSQLQSSKLHPFDLVYLDPGHPWKTTVDDVYGTLSKIGFSSIEIFQRRDHLSRPFAGTVQEFQLARRKKLRFYGLTLGPFRSLLRVLFPERVPFFILRLVFALERRSGIGPNAIKNEFTEEALFRARREST